MKLYLLKTERIGEFYVVADSLNEAEEVLMKNLNEADYGVSNARTLKSIEVITSEVHQFAGKPFFSGGDRLLLRKESL